MSDHSELKRLADTLLAIGHREDFGAWIAALEAFEKASGPDVVLALLTEVEGLREDAEKWRALLKLGCRPVPGFDRPALPHIFRNPGSDARECLACGERSGHGGLPCPRLNTYLASASKEASQ